MAEHCYIDRHGQRTCDHVHAEDLPANNPIMRGEFPPDYYDEMPGWTAQFQTNYDEKRRRFLEQQEVIDGQPPTA